MICDRPLSVFCVRVFACTNIIVTLLKSCRCLCVRAMGTVKRRRFGRVSITHACTRMGLRGRTAQEVNLNQLYCI